MDAKRRRWWSMGPVGWVLCVPLAGLVWAAATGYDLRYQLLRGITDVGGWQATFYFVTRPLVGHWFSLSDPSFGGIELCAALLVLHFSVRTINWWRYALLVGLAMTQPALAWMMPRSMMMAPSWYPPRAGIEWMSLLVVASGLWTGPVLGIVTRSWRVAGLVSAAALVCFLAVHYSPLAMGLSATTGLAEWLPKYAYIALLVGILAWWVWDERRRIRPEWACQSCGYDLRGTASGAVCPECGGAR